MSQCYSKASLFKIKFTACISSTTLQLCNETLATETFCTKKAKFGIYSYNLIK